MSPRRLRLLPRKLVAAPLRLHRDDSGSISLASVFALLLLVFILGMVMNSTRQSVQKQQLQNAADAATYSGGVVLTRGMNTLAYTNHLLSDVFALTAFMREARDRKAESLTPEILANWERVGPAFAGSEFPKFADLGQAIVDKVPHEREMVATYSEWAAAASALMLPVFEEILANRMIPEFQRALVASTPRLAQAAMDDVARRHGQAFPRPVVLRGELWRTNVDPVGGAGEEDRRTLPVVDPELDAVANQADYVKQARRQRSRLAHKYLAAWNDESLDVFDRFGKMSQFAQLFRIFSRGQLKQLLDVEYHDTNLPFQIRTAVEDIGDVDAHLEQDFMFVGVVYREKSRERIPGIFKNPTVADSQAYTQIMLFVPRRRLIWGSTNSSSSSSDSSTIRLPGDERGIIQPRTSPSPANPPASDDDDDTDYVTRQWRPRYPENWDLITQNWTLQLVPASASSIPAILSTPPYINGISDIEVPDVTGLTNDDMEWLSNH